MLGSFATFTTTTKVSVSYLPPIPLAPIYLILLFLPYLFCSLNLLHQGRRSRLAGQHKANTHSWSIWVTVTIQQATRNPIFQGDHREGTVVPHIGEARPRQTPNPAILSSTAGLHALFHGSNMGIAKGLQKQQ